MIYGDLPELSYEEKIKLSNEEIRELILAKVPTAAEWGSMNTNAKENFKIKRNEENSEELTLTVIARRFGVKGNLIGNHKYHLELGRIIYGELAELSYEEKVKLSNEEIRELILRQIPTATEWAAMDQTAKKAFKVKGNVENSEELSLYVIAGRFGVKGHPVRNHKYHLELGKMIYGDVPELLDNKLSNEEIRDVILGLISTAAEWAAMNTNAKQKFRVKGSDENSEELTLHAIAGRFGVKGHPVNNHKYHLELGKMIYGELPELFDKKLSNEEVKELILARIPTAAEWAAMNTNAKEKFRVKGSKANSEELSLYVIAGRFGVKGHPVSNHKYHLELGRIIYGEVI